MSKSKKFPVPLSYFSISLGLAALGLSLRYGAAQRLLPTASAETLLFAALTVWLLLLAAYVVKIACYRDEFYAELHDLLQCCFISTIPITAMLMGLVLLPYTHWAGTVLIGLGIVGQLAFAMYRAAGLWRGLHTLAATTPIIYLPTVASAFVSASALAALGLHDYAWLFFGMGMFSWLSLEGVILQRLRVEKEVSLQARGIVGIQLAPAFVACGSYFLLNGGVVDTFALLLIGYGLLQFLFLLRLLPWLFEGGFSMSFWGFSFGLAAMCGCGLHLTAAGRLPELGAAMAWTGATLTVLLAAATLDLMRRGRFFVR